MSYTPSQQLAIESPGNTLVVAGAGAGKTRTLVARCLLLLTGEKKVSLRNVLVVTFTEAAAAEVRHRVRESLEEELKKNPSAQSLQEQMAYLDVAHISTLHGFCYALIKEHFLELGLDPAVSVLAQETAAVMKAETLEAIFDEHYRGEHEWSGKVQELLLERFRGWDEQLGEFLLSLQTYTQTRPNPEGWFDQQIKCFSQKDAAFWKECLPKALEEWRAWWLPYLGHLAGENHLANAYAKLLGATSNNNLISLPANVIALYKDFPKGSKSKEVEPFKKILDEAEFLNSLIPNPSKDPLQEDWDYVREQVLTILRLGRQFSERYSLLKDARSAVDFHDLEQCALKLLWDMDSDGPTEIAKSWRDRFEAIFVDEYQDINAAQDLIIKLLGREGAEGNRFLVGDIKQSIYGFRQADPSIFRKYLQNGKNEGWEVVPLSENFRSHEAILNFVNGLFRGIMQEGAGGVLYNEEASLRFGNAAERGPLGWKEGMKPVIEVHLHLTSKEEEEERSEDPEEAGKNGKVDLEQAEKEARLVARRFLELKDSLEIFDEKEKRPRKIQWKDMVVLLRAAKGKSEVYAKVFHAFSIPFESKRDAFYSTQEVLDLINLLHILDNPIQDIPLLAVLHSPLAGLTATDLALVRITAEKTRSFWAALGRFHEIKKHPETWKKVDAFLTKYHRWRTNRSASLCERLELILAETGYDQWLLGQPRGKQRHANVKQLLTIARDFDASRGESLYLFLRHLEKLQDAAGDIEPASLGEIDAVRLMTIHQSKGLEFPVVAVADAGKGINQRDSSNPILLHERFGISPKIKLPETGQTYPSLTHWLSAQAKRRDTLAEEIRLLYVALTRAKNRLLIFGTTKATKNPLPGPSFAPMPHDLLKAKSWLDWIEPYLLHAVPGLWSEPFGEHGIWSHYLHREIPNPPQTELKPESEIKLTDQQLDALTSKLSWSYPHLQATRQAAKTSVTAIRQLAQSDEESAPFFTVRSKNGGKNRGTAFHQFLERMDLRHGLDIADLRAQADALVERRLIEKGQVELLDFAKIARFWNSDFGKQILNNSAGIRRELPFTARLDRESLQKVGLNHFVPISGEDYLVFQGVADLSVHMEKEIWLVDFKTDAVTEKNLKETVEEYRPQMMLYGFAMESIFHRPVTRKILHFFQLDRSIDL